MELNKGSQGFRLLTPGNPKTEKGRAQGYWTFILHFAPADLSGFNVFAMSTAGCRKACLNTAGRGGIKAGTGILSYNQVKRGVRNEIQHARRLQARAFFQFRSRFMLELAKEIAKAILKARRAGYIPVFRLYGTSDIRWESVPVPGFANIMEMFSDVTFYDYSKLPNRKNIPPNYHLTFSLADGDDAASIAAINNGMNVAAVFRNKDTVTRYVANGIVLGDKHMPVIRGDDTDLRFLNPPGHVIALYAKGNAKKTALDS
jgi:hypothetical protein